MRLLNVWALTGGVLLAQAPVGAVEEKARVRQMAMGREYARELRTETVAFDSAVVQGYVDRLGRLLAAQMPGAAPSFEFTVAEFTACPATQEPAALPGGFVFFPARLLAAARNESEFAAVIAHAVAHEVLHQRPVVVPQGGGAVPLLMLGGWTSDCQRRQSVPLGFAATWQKQEREADALAWQALEASGFDPRALTVYLQRMAESTSTEIQRGQQTERLAALPSLQATTARQDNAEFEAVRAEIRRFVEAHSTTPIAAITARQQEVMQYLFSWRCAKGQADLCLWTSSTHSVLVTSQGTAFIP
ncbi:MAG: hypothetical protein QM757_19900 [Paludibaculum sp.]